MRKTIKRKILKLSKEFKAVPKKYRLKLAYRISKFILFGEIAGLVEIVDKLMPGMIYLYFDEDDYLHVEFTGFLKDYYEKIMTLLSKRGDASCSS